jgi:tetratricopeptide (TPR) repeat protein
MHTRQLFARRIALALSLLMVLGCATPQALVVITSEPVIITATPQATATPTASQSATPSLTITLSQTPAPTGTDAPTLTPGPATCADLDAAWGDWPTTIEVLNRLIAAGRSCGPEPLTSKLYAAHFNFAAALETQGDTERAIKQYRGAVRLDPNRVDALKALARLDGLPTLTPSPCAPVNPYLADSSIPGTGKQPQFVKVLGKQLVIGIQPFRIKGVNYYPRRAPWERFLSQADPDQMRDELDLIGQAGFNTIRIFVWQQPLFTCSGSVTLPNETLFHTLDQVVLLAGNRGLKVIVTLNDLPDLYISPLYDSSPYNDAETAYIVRRYQAYPAILAWDLRNEGDLDYLGQHGEAPRFTDAQVLNWLDHIGQIVRDNDSNHLITAGWWGDPLLTASDVDFLSFHHWDKANVLAERIKNYQARTDKPLLLEEFGYAYRGTDDSTGQAALVGDVAHTAEAQGLLGWMIWSAFDFEAAPGQDDNYQNYYGLWTLDLLPKAALQALPLP